jgi:hypothetical protein
VSIRQIRNQRVKRTDVNKGININAAYKTQVIHVKISRYSRQGVSKSMPLTLTNKFHIFGWKILPRSGGYVGQLIHEHCLSSNENEVSALD